MRMVMNEQETAAVLGDLSENLKELQSMDSNAILQMLKGWIPGILSIGTRLLIAVVIFFVGRKVINIVQKMLRRSFERAGIEISVVKFLHSLIGFGLNVILIFVIAGYLGFNSASIVALLGSAGLALGLALQGSLANFAGSILILVMKPFKVGDYIVAPQAEGTVSIIGLVYTTLMTVDNKAVTVPNGTLSNSIITNVTAMSKRRVDLTVSIGYDSDLGKAKAILERIYREHPAIMKTEELVVYVDRLAENAVLLGARGWVTAALYWTTRWEILEAVKLEFDKEGIKIPYNQMDVHIVSQSEREETYD